MNHRTCHCEKHNRQGTLVSSTNTMYKCTRIGCDGIYSSPVATCQRPMRGGAICGAAVRPEVITTHRCVCPMCQI